MYQFTHRNVEIVNLVLNSFVFVHFVCVWYTAYTASTYVQALSSNSLLYMLVLYIGSAMCVYTYMQTVTYVRTYV